jgi:nucleoside-diphosphate-sugar epimerase
VRAFVTGATGFVGSHLVEALLARGDDVVALVRNRSKADRRFGDRQPDYVEGDLHDEEALRRGAKQADVIFHIAGITSARDLSEFRRINEDGTRKVVEAAIHQGGGLRRMLLVSSLSAAGPTTRGVRLTEDVVPHPLSDYGRTKLAAERIVEASGLPFAIVRPPPVYGPHDMEVRRLFTFAARGFAPVFADGGQELSFVYIDDLVSAMLAAVERSPPDRTYFVCHPEVLTQEAFVMEVSRAVSAVRSGQARPPRVLLRIPGWAARVALNASDIIMGTIGSSSVLSTDKLREFLAEAWSCSPEALERDAGWRAEVPADEGLRRTAAWYRQHGWL